MKGFSGSTNLRFIVIASISNLFTNTNLKRLHSGADWVTCKRGDKTCLMFNGKLFTLFNWKLPCKSSSTNPSALQSLSVLNCQFTSLL